MNSLHATPHTARIVLGTLTALVLLAAMSAVAASTPVTSDQFAPGWQEHTHGITKWDELPPAARAYLRALEELAGCPLAIVSTGPDRDANIVLRDPWA